MTRLCAAFAAALWLAGAALAQDAREPAAPAPQAVEPDAAGADRYALVPLEDGLMRVDKRTGEVSRCSDAGGPLTCRLLPDERMAYEAEIDRLNRRVDALETDVAALKSEPPAAAADDEMMPPSEEIDRFVDLAEQIMRRFFGLVKELKGENDRTEL